jgi:hypothetical protein
MTDDQLHLTVTDLAVAANDGETLDRIAAQLDAQDEQRRARLERPEALAEAAGWYAAHGIAVFPLRPGSKVPLTINGFKAATTDSEQVARWWQRTPAANVGLPTGLTFDVIDVDGPAGVVAIAPFVEEIRRDALGLVSTPRPGGLHYYVPPVGDRGNRAGLLPDVDYRGTGGYVVAPPSVNAEGRRWTWLRPIQPNGAP